MRALLCCNILLCVTLKAPAQSGPLESSSTLRTGTHLVVVDVIVQDHDGHAVRGLKQNDFQLEEGKTAQTLRTFEEHGGVEASGLKPPPVPPLPAGVFTDYTPVPDHSTLNILLLDSLNTITRDQGYVRSQLRKYLEKADPSTRIAIFGLSARLTLLQGFTSDPAILQAAIEQKGKPRASVLLPNATGSNASPVHLADQLNSLGSEGQTMNLAVQDTITQLQQFNAVDASLQAQVRTRFTLDAFNQLARYLSAFPGRKNLIWFSGSFPIALQPDPDIANPFDAARDNSGDFRETINLLTRARVAVYPVDAQEVLNAPAYASGNTGLSLSKEPVAGARDDIDKFNDDQANSHVTMVNMADETGGHAFYEGRPLVEVVQRTIQSGSSYYTLIYTPVNRDWKGEYRAIHVHLQGEPAARKLTLAYRRGYYADDPESPHGAKVSNLLSPADVAAPTTGSSAYAFAAMRHGAPMPSEVLFTARVLPDSLATTDKPATHNSPNPKGPFKGPYRSIDIDIAALPQNFQFTPAENGIRHGSVEYVTYVYDSEGHLLNTDGTTLEISLSPEQYAQVSSVGLGFRQQASVPTKGESFLRIGVHDIPSGRFGVVEVPTSTVLRLPLAPAVPGGNSH